MSFIQYLICVLSKYLVSRKFSKYSFLSLLESVNGMQKYRLVAEI